MHKIDDEAAAQFGSRFALDRERLPSGLRVYVCRYGRTTGFRRGVAHRRLELGVTLSGSWKQHATFGTARRSDSQCFFVNPGEVHDIEYGSTDTDGVTVLFACEPRSYLGVKDLVRLRVRSLDGIEKALEELAREIIRARNESTSLPDIDSFFRAQLSSRADSSESSAGWSGFERARAELEASFHADLYVHHLAELAGMHPETFTRTFNRRVGMTPVQYRNTLRIDEASELGWQSPSMPVTAIAQACGISHMGYFHRAFKQSFGTTPGKHRTRRNS